MTDEMATEGAPSTEPAGPPVSPPVGPPNALAVPRYAGPDTFARLPRLSEVGSAAVAIAGIPFDSGVSYRPGARFGPASVRAGSKLLRPYHPGLEVRERVGDRPVYVSVDIDVLDPAHAPGTGTPEPGGLTTRGLQLILRGLDGLRLAGADIVEVAPAYDHAELTSLAAANVV